MITYIWIESWSFRNAIRSALNGYDYVMVGKMAVLLVKELKYKRMH